jgi:hypothetical protein
MSERIEFSNKIKRLVAERAAFRCSVPWCDQTTIGPGNASDQIASTGMACHIYSAAPGGPRGRGGLSDEQLGAPENALWCCYEHGKLIDTNAGDRFPASLLVGWKRAHEARIDRERKGIVVAGHGWIHEAEAIESPFFKPGAGLRFAKATLLDGPNSSGKSALCQCLAGFSIGAALNRWSAISGWSSKMATRLRYFAPDERIAELAVQGEAVHRLWNNSIRYQALADLKIIYMRERLGRSFDHQMRPVHDHTDDSLVIAEAVGCDKETVVSLAQEVNRNGSPWSRQLEFKVEGEGGKREWHLYCSLGRSARVPFKDVSETERAAVVLEFAAAYARVEALKVPTLLILDAGGWTFDPTTFENYIGYLMDQPFQILMTRPKREYAYQGDAWKQWRLFLISGPEAPRRIVEADRLDQPLP